MVRRSSTTDERPTPRLYLISPSIGGAPEFARMLREVLGTADIAALLLRLAPGSERELISRAKVIAPMAQEHGAAVLLDGHPDLVVRAGADGAHLTGITALREAVGGLQPARIAGVGGLTTRHDAMLAGQAGADYLMFGEPDAAGRRPSFAAVVERVAWWAEVFELPCVGYAGSRAEAAPLAAAGADFVALGEWVWTAEEGAAAAVAGAGRELLSREQVT